MKFNQLSAFRAVMRCGTVTAAAKTLNITQPAVTRLLHSLEDRTGFPLFELIRGRLVPTEEGQAFFLEVNKAFIVLEKLEDCAKTIRNRPCGIIHIASMPMLSLCFIPQVIGQMDTDFQKTILRNYRSREVQQIVEVGGCDLGFAILPDDSIINAEMVRFEGEMCCLLPPQNGMQGKKVIEPSDLHQKPLICYEHNEPQDMINAAFMQSDVSFHSVAETSFAFSVGSMVAAGIGYGLVDSFTAIHFSQSGLSFKPFKPSLPFHFDILFPSNCSLSTTTKIFLRLFFKNITDEGIKYKLTAKTDSKLVTQIIRDFMPGPTHRSQ